MIAPADSFRFPGNCTGTSDTLANDHLMKPVRVVSIIEATTLTGPGKPLIEFAKIAGRQAGSGIPPAQISLLTFTRGAAGKSNLFIETARAAGLEVDVVH